MFWQVFVVLTTTISTFLELVFLFLLKGRVSGKLFVFQVRLCIGLVMAAFIQKKLHSFLKATTIVLGNQAYL